MPNVCRDLIVPAVHPRDECGTLCGGAVQRLSRAGKSLWAPSSDLIVVQNNVYLLATQGIRGPSPATGKIPHRTHPDGAHLLLSVILSFLS